MWTVGEMLDTLHIQNILNGSGGLNYTLIFNMLKNAGYAIQFVTSMRNLVVAFFAGDFEDMLLAVANGAASVMGMVGICESHMAMQLLTKALAVYGVKENAEAFLKAADKGDVGEMLVYGLNIAMDVITIFAACFDGDTLVATEDGFKRIDMIQVGERVWSYNVETGEKSLKEVKQVFVKQNDGILHLKTTEGEIDATTSHPFYVIDKGWVAAGDLLVGDAVHTLDGVAGTVTGFKIEKLDKPIPVYNIEVEDFNSYFVGNGLLVHNTCPDAQHHTFPKYLGGDPDQILFPLPKDVHNEIHGLIDKVFPRQRPKGYYTSVEDPLFLNDVYDSLITIYKKYEVMYPGIVEKFKNAFNR
jgi:hypothetical protein